MKIAVVTTFNNKLYEQYAKTFMKTYYDNMPFDLYVYTEDDVPLDKHKRLTHLSTFNEVKECKEFIDRNKDRPLVPPARFRNPSGIVKPYRHDGVRFCYKVYAYTDFILNKSDQYDGVICIDADCEFENPFDQEAIASTQKEDAMMTYIGRVGYYSECGFLYFNLKHNDTKKYALEMQKMYNEDLIYQIPEQHDSYVWDYVRINFEQIYKTVNHNIGDAGKGDVHARSFLSKYYKHYKGRKGKLQMGATDSITWGEKND